MDIKVGQKWKTRDGRTVTITDELYCTDYHYIYPFITETGARYTRGGLFKEGETGPRDLVELLEKEYPMNLDIKVGQEWLTRGGNIVTLKESPDNYFVPFVGSNGMYYNAVGETTEKYCDLIELVKDVPCNSSVSPADSGNISITKAVYETHRWECGNVRITECEGNLSLFIDGRDPIYEVSYANLKDLQTLLNAHLT